MKKIKQMTFRQYLEEASVDLTPPSGNKIGAAVKPNKPPVQGDEIELGDDTYKIAQVDHGADSVKVKDATGKETWVSNEIASQMTGGIEDQNELNRIKQLAGLGEDTCAGGIAAVGQPMGQMIKRSVDESPKKEYKRSEPYKSIIGDTKPHQASKELSANLAAQGKKTVYRKNNGI